MRTDGQGNASIELACGMTEEVVRTFGRVRLRVFGSSMATALLPGDLVSIQSAILEEISMGEIVLFQRDGRLFVHRVVGAHRKSGANGTNEPCLITRGDRLLQDDPQVSSQELLGRVASVERDNRRVEVAKQGSNGWIARLLRASDRFTYLYLRMCAGWRGLFFRGARCQV
jgi:hypothetical protein